MTGQWTMIEPGMGQAVDVDRLYASGEGAMSWSHILMHVTMLLVVMVVTVVVILVTTGAIMLAGDEFHETLAAWDWAPLEDAFRLILIDLLTDDQGAPIF